MRAHIGLLALAGAAALVGPAVAHATVITFQQGANGYSGAVDTYIANRASDINVNFSGSGAIWVDAGPEQYQGLLRFGGIFGNGPGQIPLGSTINSATLTLTVDTITSAEGSGSQLFRMVQSWNASDTWTTGYGSNGVQTDGIEALATSDGFIGANSSANNLAQGAVANANVTATLQAWSGGAVNNGWLLNYFPLGTGGLALASSDNGTASRRPLLTVDYTAVPEPATLTVLAGAIVLLNARRRHS